MTIMRDEILEQAGVVARLAADAEPYRAAAAEARAAGVRFVLYAARGTSDNAAVYGKYLATILAGLYRDASPASSGPVGGSLPLAGQADGPRGRRGVPASPTGIANADLSIGDILDQTRHAGFGGQDLLFRPLA